MTDHTVVLVTGSMRSGTSSLAGSLKQLGWHVPQPEVPASDRNAKGVKATVIETTGLLAQAHELAAIMDNLETNGETAAPANESQNGEKPRPRRKKPERTGGE